MIDESASCNVSGMSIDTARAKRIIRIREAAGLSQEEFADALGVSRGAVGNWELGKGIRLAYIDAISEMYEHVGVTSDWISKGKGNAPDFEKIEASADLLTKNTSTLPKSKDLVSNTPSLGQPDLIGGTVDLSHKIPVYGQAMGGRDGEFVLNGNKIADILAPPSLMHVKEAYAVYVSGDSMSPRYEAGEAVFVNPKLPVRKGDYVVVQIAAGQGDPPHGFVKRFVSMDEKTLKLSQWNPKKSLSFARSKVVSVHRIVMGGDG